MASRERLGTAVAARRRHLGMSVPEAARRSGLDRETWRHLEAGTRTLRSYNHSRVERALNWAPGSVAAILGGGAAPRAGAAAARRAGGGSGRGGWRGAAAAAGARRAAVWPVG